MMYDIEIALIKNLEATTQELKPTIEIEFGIALQIMF